MHHQTEAVKKIGKLTSKKMKINVKIQQNKIKAHANNSGYSRLNLCVLEEELSFFLLEWLEW